MTFKKFLIVLFKKLFLKLFQVFLLWPDDEPSLGSKLVTI